MVATNAAFRLLPGAPSGAEAIQHPCTPGVAASMSTPPAGNAPANPATRTDFCSTASRQVLEERVDGAVHAQYIWCLRYIDSPVLRDRDTPESGTAALDETLYYTTDANMNVTTLVAPGSGDVVERYRYDPYGRVEVLTGSGDPDPGGWDTFENEILFTGHRLNPETGLYHARNRAYHPSLGRFMQRDPLGYVDGMSLYAGYFAMWGGVDPGGLSSEVIIDNGTIQIHQKTGWWPFRGETTWPIGQLGDEDHIVELGRGGTVNLNDIKQFAKQSSPNWEDFLDFHGGNDPPRERYYDLAVALLQVIRKCQPDDHDQCPDELDEHGTPYKRHRMYREAREAYEDAFQSLDEIEAMLEQLQEDFENAADLASSAKQVADSVNRMASAPGMGSRAARGAASRAQTVSRHAGNIGGVLSHAGTGAQLVDAAYRGEGMEVALSVSGLVSSPVPGVGQFVGFYDQAYSAAAGTIASWRFERRNINDVRRVAQACSNNRFAHAHDVWMLVRGFLQ